MPMRRLALSLVLLAACAAETVMTCFSIFLA